MDSEAKAQILAEAIKNEKIRRAMLAGPSCITAEATVAEMDATGQMTVLRPGTNDWNWMLIWPFDAKAAGLSTVMRDAGTMVMFAGTPYAHLHICGSPWDGNEYHPGDRGVWTMTYSPPQA